jgi:hypothetical protein
MHLTSRKTWVSVGVDCVYDEQYRCCRAGAGRNRTVAFHGNRYACSFCVKETDAAAFALVVHTVQTVWTGCVAYSESLRCHRNKESKLRLTIQKEYRLSCIIIKILALCQKNLRIFRRNTSGVIFTTDSNTSSYGQNGSRYPLFIQFGESWVSKTCKMKLAMWLFGSGNPRL